MPRWCNLRLTVAASVAVCGPVVAQPGTAQADAAMAGFGDAVRACIGAITPAGVDESKLVGWTGVDLSMDAKDQEPLRVLTRGRGPLIVAGTGKSAARSGCNVLSPTPAGLRFEDEVNGMSLVLGAPPTDRRRKGGEVMWVVGNIGTVLAPAGRVGQPAIRATIVHIGELK